jgi:hypothetical protein
MVDEALRSEESMRVCAEQQECSAVRRSGEPQRVVGGEESSDCGFDAAGATGALCVLRPSLRGGSQAAWATGARRVLRPNPRGGSQANAAWEPGALCALRPSPTESCQSSRTVVRAHRVVSELGRFAKLVRLVGN